MLERATLHVLAEAAEIGLPEAALVPASAFDPFFRPALKRRVQRAVDEATAKTTRANVGDHVLRLAFLLRHPQTPQLDPNDIRAVEQAFASLAAEYLPPRPAKDPTPAGGAYRAGPERRPDEIAPPPKRKKRFWPITTPLVASILLGATATAAVVAIPYLVPSPIARFRKTPAGEAFAEPLTDWIAGDRGEARTKLLAPAVKKQIGAPAFDALSKTVDVVPAVSSSEVTDIDEASAPLFASLNATNARLLDAKVPAYLHGYASGNPGHRSVWITSYFVERRDELAFEGGTYRVVWGRRLDNLNLADSNVYKAAAEDWMILSLDRIEEEFVQSLLSPIATGSPMAPAELEVKDGSARAELAKTAGRVVSEEVTKASGFSRSDADGLRRAIARRNEAALGLAKTGYRLQATSRIELEPHVVRRLKRSSDRAAKDEKVLFDELLTMNERMSLYRRSVAPAVAELARIEEEELAGRFEAEKRLEKTSVPALGEENDTPYERGFASAQLGLLARTQACPRLALMHVARVLLDTRSFAYDDAVRVVLLELLVELQLLPRPAPGVEHFVDDAFLNGLRGALELPPEKVRDAAGRAYQRMFGRPAPTLAAKKL